MTAPLRVLISAELANPEWVSVPLEGWSLANAIRALDGVETHIVTQIRNRDAFLRAGLIEGKDFTAIDSEKVAAPAYKVASALRMGKGKGWTTVMAMNAVAYPYYERLLWQRFKPRLAAGEFDLVHRVTPLSPTIPSRLAQDCKSIGVPFVMGPMNGGLPWPRGFDAERRREKEWLSYVRGAYKLLPGRGRTLANASAVIAGSRHTEAEMDPRYRSKYIYIPENAVDPARFSQPPKQGLSTPLRCAFLGRLVPYKGPDMLIEALAPMLAEGRLVLDMIGDGPMRGALEAQAKRLGADAAVTFHGNVPHTEVQRILGQCDLFTFPSVREFGGAVVLEAMTLGVVPVIIDYGGPGEHVTPQTGFALPISDRAGIIAAFRNQIAALVEDPSALPAMSAACVDRVARKYTWERKAAQIRDVYDWVLGETTEKPDPFMSA